jgi:hypothetical protein
MFLKTIGFDKNFEIKLILTRIVLGCVTLWEV